MLAALMRKRFVRCPIVMRPKRCVTRARSLIVRPLLLPGLFVGYTRADSVLYCKAMTLPKSTPSLSDDLISTGT